MEVKPEPEKQAEIPTQPSEPQVIVKEVIKEVPVVNQEEVQKQVEAKLQERLKAEQEERRKLANVARAKKKTDNLNRVLEFARERKMVTNDDVRDFLHISQSTATNYLMELVNRGMLKREGERGGTKYTA